MSVKKILEEDWSEYDNKKIIAGSDRALFACTETWEVDYLTKKIRKHHPEIPELVIRIAIINCCSEVKAPHPRKAFVECVASGLKISID